MYNTMISSGSSTYKEKSCAHVLHTLIVTYIKCAKLIQSVKLLHGEKFISKLYYFHKKNHYFFSDAETHSKSRIFTILNSTF